MRGGDMTTRQTAAAALAAPLGGPGDPERVRAVQAALPAPDVVGELAEVFGLLSDPGRLRLLASLLEGGELCVCDLAAAAGMAESTTSHALRLLRAHRVVKARRAG